MAIAHDPLRGTLDTMHVAPDAGAERPYLVSMLRRLGYSETEIREIIRDQETPKGSGPREIEVEYTGHGMRDYMRVLPPVQPGFDLNRPGELIEFGSPETEFQVLEGENLLEFEPFNEELMEFAVPVEEAQQAWDPAAQPPGTTTIEQTTVEETFESTPPQDEWAEDKAPYQYGEWTLYKRDVESKDGGTTPVYFFAKDQPKAGEASPKPEGYEVGVNDRTGLPFLRRSMDLPSDAFEVNPEDLPQAARRGVERIAGRRRVRVLRVRARSREEAEGKLAAADRQVLGSVPINIEEKWDQ